MKQHLGKIILGFLFCFGFYAVFSDYGDSTEPATKKTKSQITNKKVDSGDTVYGILRSMGFSDAQRNAALASNILPSNFVLAPGDLYQVVKQTQAKRTEVVFFDRFKNKIYSFWKTSEDAGAAVKKAALRSIVTKARGEIRGSLVESITRVVGDDALAYRFMDAFVLDYDLVRGIQRGAKFSLTYEKLYSGPSFIRPGEILHAELEVDGEMRSREFRRTENGGVFVAPRDNHQNRPLYAPVDYIRVSSLYQPRRFHPVKKVRRAHLGVDFELPQGENIYAAQSGQIIRMGRNRAAGNFIVLRHSGGLETYYNHMSSLQRGLRKGVYVRAGAVIGSIGCTGYCTKPHLHFAVKKHGRFVNPISLIRRYNYAQSGIKFSSASVN